MFEALKPSHVSGITFSGGDPLHPMNRDEIGRLIRKFKKEFPNKTAWLYTGFLWEEIKDVDGVSELDVLADGEFVLALKDEKLPWVGSSNQRVIDVKESFKQIKLVLFCD